MTDRGEWHHHKADVLRDDNGYFENMSRVIFGSGLNWATVEKKWPGIRVAFDNFDISIVAAYDERKMDALMADSDVIRNLPKIRAVVRNAETILGIVKENGSLKNYLNHLTKTDGESYLISTISKQFAFLGKSTAVIFLLSVGVSLPETTKNWHGRHA